MLEVYKKGKDKLEKLDKLSSVLSFDQREVPSSLPLSAASSPTEMSNKNKNSIGSKCTKKAKTN